MTDRKTSAELQDELESERSALAESLGRLQDQFTAERLVQTLGDQITQHSGDITKSVTRTVRDNPLAVAAIGAGALWLIAGTRPSTDNDVYRTDQGAAYDRRSRDTASGFRSETAGETFEERMERLSADTRAEPDKDTTIWSRMMSKASDTKDRAADAAVTLAERLYEGTENMSEAAAERVARARMRVLDAQDEIVRGARRTGRAVKRHANGEPLLWGAVALGLGVVAGMLIPRTKTEDEAIGAYRDRALSEAERIFREEKAKLRAVADAALAETKDVVKDAASAVDESVPEGEDVVKSAEDKARSAVSRVADAAKSEAEAQNLGGRYS